MPGKQNKPLPFRCVENKTNPSPSDAWKTKQTPPPHVNKTTKQSHHFHVHIKQSTEPVRWYKLTFQKIQVCHMSQANARYKPFIYLPISFTQMQEMLPLTLAEACLWLLVCDWMMEAASISLCNINWCMSLSRTWLKQCFIFTDACLWHPPYLNVLHFTEEDNNREFTEHFQRLKALYNFTQEKSAMPKYLHTNQWHKNTWLNILIHTYSYANSKTLARTRTCTHTHTAEDINKEAIWQTDACLYHKPKINTALLPKQCFTLTNACFCRKLSHPNNASLWPLPNTKKPLSPLLNANKSLCPLLNANKSLCPLLNANKSLCPLLNARKSPDPLLKAIKPLCPLLNTNKPLSSTDC